MCQIYLSQLPAICVGTSEQVNVIPVSWKTQSRLTLIPKVGCFSTCQGSEMSVNMGQKKSSLKPRTKKYMYHGKSEMWDLTANNCKNRHKKQNLLKEMADELVEASVAERAS